MEFWIHCTCVYHPLSLPVSADPCDLSGEEADWLSTLFDAGSLIGGYVVVDMHPERLTLKH